MAMQKQKKAASKVVTATEEREKRNRKRIANSHGSESSMASELRNTQHNPGQPAH
jgi:hypothetical protein